MAHDLYFAIGIGAEQYNVKLNISFVRVLATIAVHYLEVYSNFVFHNLVRLDKVYRHFIDDGIQHRLSSQPPTVDEHVENNGSKHATCLVVPKLDQLVKLLFPLSIHLLDHLFLCLVVVAVRTSIILFIERRAQHLVLVFKDIIEFAVCLCLVLGFGHFNLSL